MKFYDLRENPCHKAGTMGKKNAEEMLFWTQDEFKVFIEAMKDRPVGYTIFMVMYYRSTCGRAAGSDPGGC